MLKILQAPEFIEGKQYRALHPTKEGKRKWRFVLEQDITVPLDVIANSDHGMHSLFLGFDEAGIHRLTIARSSITVHKGYAWNGCTPKRWFPIVGWVGTPDFEGTRVASCVHDALYQFHDHEGYPFTRKEADSVFAQLMGEKKLKVTKAVYHWAVRWFGSWPKPKVEKDSKPGPRHR